MQSPTIDDLLKHASCLRDLALSLFHDESLADDLVQDTWLAVLQRPPKHGANLAGWLRVVASRLFYKQLRREEIRSTEEVDDSTPEPDSTSAERAKLWSELSRAVVELRDPYREVVVLRFYEGLPPREIVRRTGRPLNTVNSQLQRGLALLRQELDERGGRSRWLPVLTPLLGRSRSRPWATIKSASVSHGWWAFPAAAVLIVVLGVTMKWGRPEPLTSVAAAEPSTDRAADDVELTPATRRPAGARVPVTQDELAPSPATETLGSLRVRVVDASGLGVSRAVVMLGSLALPGGILESHPRRLAGRTDEDGYIDVVVQQDDIGSFQEMERCVFVVAGAQGRVSTEGVYVPLKPGARRALTLTLGGGDACPLSGRVLDSEGTPVEGAEVEVGGEPRSLRREGELLRAWFPRLVRTGRDGWFQVPGLAPGRYPVEVGAVGYARAHSWFEPGQTELIVRLTRGATLSGSVRDADRASVPGATLFVEPDRLAAPIQVESDAQGRYRIEGISPGFRYVWCLDEDRVAVDRVRFVAGGELVWDPLPAPRAGLRLRCVRADGRPIAGGVIRLSLPHDSFAWTRRLPLDLEGSIQVWDCPHEPIDLHVYESANDMREGRPPLYAVQRLACSFEEQVLVAPKPSQPGRLSGVILDAGRRPLAESVLFLFDAGGVILPFPASPETGRFAVDELPPGDYDVVVYAGSLGAHPREPVHVPSGSELDVGALQLPETGTVALRWGWPDGHTLEMGQLAAGRLWTTAIEPEPTSRELELLPGRHRFTVKREGAIVERRHVEVSTGNRVELVSGPRRKVEVSLVVSAEPATGLTLSYVREGDDPLGLETPELQVVELSSGAEGKVEHVLALTTGGWRLRLEGADGRHVEQVVEVKPGRAPPPVSLILAGEGLSTR